MFLQTLIFALLVLSFASECDSFPSSHSRPGRYLSVSKYFTEIFITYPKFLIAGVVVLPPTSWSLYPATKTVWTPAIEMTDVVTTVTTRVRPPTLTTTAATSSAPANVTWRTWWLEDTGGQERGRQCHGNANVIHADSDEVFFCFIHINCSPNSKINKTYNPCYSSQ